MQIILASASPRRRELLSRLYKDFKVIPAVGAERVDGGLSAEAVALSLAEAKCEEVFSTNPESLIVACDTIVVYEGRILGKPKDAEDAEATLGMLSGRTHRVITGVCVRSPYKKLKEYATTEVTFNELDERFIADYVAGGSPMDKAGSYGIQDGGIVKSYLGSYTNVVGLPVELVERMIAAAMTDD